jgi:hypothetical protein
MTGVGGTRKEAKEMHHYVEFDPHLIGERNRQIFEEVQSLRLEKVMRKIHEGSGSRQVAYFLRLASTLHSLHGHVLQGSSSVSASTAPGLWGELCAHRANAQDRQSNEKF